MELGCPWPTGPKLDYLMTGHWESMTTVPNRLADPGPEASEEGCDAYLSVRSTALNPERGIGDPPQLEPGGRSAAGIGVAVCVRR